MKTENENPAWLKEVKDIVHDKMCSGDMLFALFETGCSEVEAFRLLYNSSSSRLPVRR
jgi:hypothetical protein